MKEKEKLSESDLQYLNTVIENKNELYNERTIRRAKAIKMWNYGKGKPYNEIICETGFSRRTLQYLFKNVKQKDIFEINYKKYPKSKLDIVKDVNDDYIYNFFKKKENIPSTYKEATETIKKYFYVSISESAVRRYLQKHEVFTEKSKR